MKHIYAFTISTKEKYYEEGDCIAGHDGDLIGRVLHCLKIEIDPENIYYSYDVESTPEYYEKLKSGYQLYKVSEFSVHECSTYYTRG